MTSRPLQPRHEPDVDTGSNGEVVQDDRDHAPDRATPTPGTRRGEEVAPERGDRDGVRGRAVPEHATTPVPDRPQRDGVDAPELGISDVEPAHLLENEARAKLSSAGFTDQEIEEWTRAYFAEHTAGDTAELVEWVRAKQRGA